MLVGEKGGATGENVGGVAMDVGVGVVQFVDGGVKTRGLCGRQRPYRSHIGLELVSGELVGENAVESGERTGGGLVVRDFGGDVVGEFGGVSPGVVVGVEGAGSFHHRP